MLSTRSAGSAAELFAAAETGAPRALARLVTWVEEKHPELPSLLQLANKRAKTAQIIGLTGSPGAGKSTLTSALIAEYRRRDLRVAVLAIDPSSPFSGGALLGDRIRMQDHVLDPNVYIRSMSARGHLGGLSRATPQAAQLLSSVGFDIVLIETVGVGQSEVEIAGLADTVVVALAPGMGDGIQAAKAGILEIGDIYVVTKGDRPGADQVRRELRAMLPNLADSWQPSIVKTQGLNPDPLVNGTAALVDLLSKHQQWLIASGVGAARRRRRIKAELVAIACENLQQKLSTAAELTRLTEKVVAGELDPFQAAVELASS